MPRLMMAANTRKGVDVRRVVVQTKTGEMLYVRSGEIIRDWRGRAISFAFLKLTTSKRWAAKFSGDAAYEAASAINVSLDTGFYPYESLEFAHEGSEC